MPRALTARVAWGDRYRIRIPESLDAKMSAWGLAPDIIEAIEGRLKNDLATDPASKLVRCNAPWDERLNLYSFIMPGSEPHIQHLFMFHFVYGDDEASLHMVECGYSLINTKPEGPAFPGIAPAG